MALITAKNLTLGYDGHPIAEGISFAVNEGDYLYIVGENGSGKTTLMKVLLRLKRPLGGEIIMGDGLKADEIGYLPQQTRVQKDFPASVREIVLSGCQGRMGLRPFYGKKENALADKNMERMGLKGCGNKFFRELSGGRQQRVLIARALCATGKLLLMDEPVSGLDPKITAEMYALIKELNDGGLTVVMISHDIYSAAKYASHVLHIGEKIFFGTRSEYLKSEVCRCFLQEEVSDPRVC